MNNKASYTQEDVRQMRDVTFMTAQSMYTKRVPDADINSESYWANIMQLSESLLQTHIMAGLSLDDAKETYYNFKD